MAVYGGVIIPDNYKEVCDLGTQIGNIIYKGDVPEPSGIAKVLGYEAVDAYFFMHALMHSIEHIGGGISVFRPARRDGKAVQIHSYDMALKSYYRLMDPVLPSGYLLTPREIVGDLIHDLGEGFGNGLLGALVVNDVINSLLGEEAAKDAKFLTDKNGLLLDSIEKRIEPLSIINHDSIYEILNVEYKKNGWVNSESIQDEYRKVSNALSSFRTHVEQMVNLVDEQKDMADEQKDALIAIISRMSGNVEIKLKNGEVLEPKFVTEHIKSQFEHVMEIMGSNKYIQADPELVPPRYPEFLVTLDKTLYQDYIDGIVEEIKREAIYAYEHGKPNNDSYLGLGMEKLTDATDNAIKMQIEPFRNATDIFRNSRRTIEGMTGLVEDFRKQDMAHERLQRGVDYLIRNLGAVVNYNFDALKERKSKLSEEYWDNELEGFQYMVKKAADLEKKIAPIVHEGEDKKGLLRRIGSMIHIF